MNTKSGFLEQISWSTCFEEESETIHSTRLQRVFDVRHSDDYSLNKALRARLRSQKKRVAEEEIASRKAVLGLRLLPASEKDASMAKRVKFSPGFEKNKKEKRVAIGVAPIFHVQPGASSSSARRLELESKRRRIKAFAASYLLSSGIKLSSWSSPTSMTGPKRMVVASRTC